MKLFRFILASLLALVLVLSPALSYANTATLPKGFQMPAVGEVAKRVVSRSNAVVFAVEGLLGAVDWVLDPKNNQVIYNIPTGNYCSVNESKDCVNTLEEAEKKFIRFYNNYARSEVLRDSDVECKFEFRGSTASITCYWGFPDEKLKFRQFTYHGKVVPNRISNEQVAEQIIKNAQAGHAESVDFVVDVANELKQQTGAKPIVKKTELQCKKIKDECISTCSEISLPTRDNGFSFFQCVNQCLEKEGCL